MWPAALKIFGHTTSGLARIWRDEFGGVCDVSVSFLLDDGPLLKSLVEYDAFGEVLIRQGNDSVGFGVAKVSTLEISWSKESGAKAEVSFLGFDKGLDTNFEVGGVTAPGLGYMRSDLFGDEIDAFEYWIHNNAVYQYTFSDADDGAGAPWFKRLIQSGRRQESGSISFSDKKFVVPHDHPVANKQDRLTIIVPGGDFSLHPVVFECSAPGALNWYQNKNLSR